MSTPDNQRHHAPAPVADPSPQRAALWELCKKQARVIRRWRSAYNLTIAELRAADAEIAELEAERDAALLAADQLIAGGGAR